MAAKLQTMTATIEAMRREIEKLTDDRNYSDLEAEVVMLRRHVDVKTSVIAGMTYREDTLMTKIVSLEQSSEEVSGMFLCFAVSLCLFVYYLLMREMFSILLRLTAYIAVGVLWERGNSSPRSG